MLNFGHLAREVLESNSRISAGHGVATRNDGTVTNLLCYAMQVKALVPLAKDDVSRMNVVKAARLHAGEIARP